MTNYTFRKTHDIDKEKFAELLLAAKGDRSLRSFAAACNVYPSTFTRIIQKANKGASSIELIEAIAENADPNSGITLETLAEANGYTIKWYETYAPESIAHDVAIFNNALRNVITQELLNRGASVRIVNTLSNHKAYNISKSYCIKPTLHILTDAFHDEQQTWIIRSLRKIELEEKFLRKNLEERVLQEICFLVLLHGMLTQSAAGNKMHFSFAVSTRWMFDSVVDAFCDTVVPADISIILVDIKNSIIEDEYMLPHITLGHRPSYFMTTEKVIAYNDPDLDENEGEEE